MKFGRARASFALAALLLAAACGGADDDLSYSDSSSDVYSGDSEDLTAETPSSVSNGSGSGAGPGSESDPKPTGSDPDGVPDQSIPRLDPGVATEQATPTLDERAAASELAGAASGRITHNVPDQMVEQETRRIVVTIGDFAESDEFLTAMQRVGEVEPAEESNIDELDVTPTMRVRLTAAPSIRVSSDSSETQRLVVGEVTQWGFLVTPTEPGAHQLTITAEAVVGDIGRAVVPAVYNGSVDVAVASLSTTDQIRRSMDSLLDGGTVLAGLVSGMAAVVAMVQAARGRRWRRRSSDASPIDLRRTERQDPAGDLAESASPDPTKTPE